MNIIHCDPTHAGAILEILNEAIVHSTALYDYHPRSPESMTTWFANKRAGSYPVLGAVSPHGELLGFASYGVFRAYPAYKYTVEHSVYVAAAHRGQGVGRSLLEQLIVEAQSQQYHVLIGCVDSQNGASISLHRKLGFEHAGTAKQVGFKFGRWLDLDFYQKILNTPREPADG